MGRETRIYELFARLLDYPTEDQLPAIDECIDLLSTDWPEAALELLPFVQFAGGSRLEKLQEVYTATFDLQPLCHPYVGYQLCGEGRQRAQFLVKLGEIYREKGHTPGGELADHLVEVLRFLALPGDEAARRELLEEGLLPALQKMTDGFEQPDHPYGQMLRSLQIFLGGESALRTEAKPEPTLEARP
jgi:nitrate reductase delta subunit